MCFSFSLILSHFEISLRMGKASNCSVTFKNRHWVGFELRSNRGVQFWLLLRVKMATNMRVFYGNWLMSFSFKRRSYLRRNRRISPFPPQILATKQTGGWAHENIVYRVPMRDGTQTAEHRSMNFWFRFLKASVTNIGHLNNRKICLLHMLGSELSAIQ